MLVLELPRDELFARRRELVDLALRLLLRGRQRDRLGLAGGGKILPLLGLFFLFFYGFSDFPGPVFLFSIKLNLLASGVS